ncbi:MAG: hypothetical protein KDI79_26560 [Anaerolineae bacterium]|nr:hypothetical protein [Anaerolineae bacterium]
MTKRKPKSSPIFAKAPILSKTSANQFCFEIVDSSTHYIPATFLVQGTLQRDPQAQAARLAQQFIRQNQGILKDFDISVELAYDGNTVDLTFEANTKVGALPLLSPTTGRPDYGLVIKPRFDWPGLGPMLAMMGWRVIPTPLKLPLLPRSERKIPPWVLSTIVLFRLKSLLDNLNRQFTLTEAELLAPRGQVNWSRYATACLPSAQFLRVPCRFPELRDDQELKAAIHFTLRKQLVSLEGQRAGGVVVLQLIDLCQSLLTKVKSVSPRQPSPMALNAWYRTSLKTDVFRNGLQALEWTIEDRGLAGLADLQGIAWIMSMEMFFESWIETIAEKLSRQFGGVLRTGRNRETIIPLKWTPPYVGSQRYLLPDVVLEREDVTIILDAKYKSHWEELSRHQWHKLTDVFKEQHRADLLQILAYSTLAKTKKVITCLAYPCQKDTWQSLKNRERLWHHASLYAGERQVDVILIALPMVARVEDIVQTLTKAITSIH